MPRQLTNRGDRLVFSNGSIVLSLVAIALVVAFGGNVTALIPLDAIGVFTGFTLSQTGMCVHHFRLRESRWRLHMVVNAVVALIVVVVKFTDGAWIPAALIPILVIAFTAINRHYRRVADVITVEPGYPVARHTQYVVVLVGSINKGVLQAIGYARRLAPDRLIAVSIVQDHEEELHLREQWHEFDIPVELHTISSPYRELSRPLLAYLDELDELDEESVDDIITVVIPEFVTGISTQWLHNQSALALKARLLYRPNTVVTSVPVIVE